jgi:CDP-diacylglycerol---serine O-phosphatidyltransferase
MRPFISLANVVTSTSLAAGVIALMLITDDRLGAAFAAVAVAAVLDSVDGYLARRSRSCGPFGCQLDSLADLVAFGVAPALLLHVGPLGDVQILGPAACVAFVLAGAWRLARFAVLEDSHRFTGLPIPPAGLVACGVTLLALPPGVAIGVTLTLVLLMVSEIPVPTLVALADLVPRRRRRVTLRLVGVDDAADGPSAGQDARSGGDHDEGGDEARDEKRIGAPALARE